MPLWGCSVERLQKKRGQIQEDRTGNCTVMWWTDAVRIVTCSHLGLDDVIICSKALGSFHLKQCEGHRACSTYFTWNSEIRVTKKTSTIFFILVLFTIWFHSTQINQILCSFCWTWLKQSLVCSYYYSPQLVDTKLYMFGYWRHLLDSQISGNTWSSSVLCNSLWCLSNEPFITKLINRLVTSLRIIWFDGRSFFTNFVRQICVQIIWHKY